MAEEPLTKDQERLAKLWDAYEEQEREFNLALKKISSLDGKVKETTKINSTLKKVTEGRDREIRELEIKVAALEEETEQFRPELERLEKLYQEEKERYAKLFAITEELEEELDTARVELEIRDKWFQRYFGQLENFTTALKERAIMIRESKFTSPEKVKAVKFEKLDDLPEPETNVEEASDEGEEDKKVKFESLGVEEPAPEEKEEPDKPSVSEDDLSELMKLDLVDKELAQKLFEADIKDIETLAGIGIADLITKIDGITPTMARKVVEAAKAHQPE